jgi:hypothetical protein
MTTQPPSSQACLLLGSNMAPTSDPILTRDMLSTPPAIMTSL